MAVQPPPAPPPSLSGKTQNNISTNFKKKLDYGKEEKKRDCCTFDNIA